MVKQRWVAAVALCAGLTLAAGRAEAAKIVVGEDSFADVRLLLQPRAQLTEGKGDADASLDFYLRRARVLLFGSVTKDISYFFETDSPNFGKGGNFGLSMYVQDAFISWTPKRWLALDFGLLIIPLTHHTYQGATTTNTLDYHTVIVRYPPDSTKVWRDTGLEARGLLLDDRVQYRVGVFGGVRRVTGRTDQAGAALPDINPASVPRFAGTLRFNVLEPEPDLFPQGIYLGKRRVISFGLAADYQPKAVAVGASVNNYMAIGGDVFVDLPFAGGDQEVVFQSDVIHYSQGDDAATSGTGFFVEGGYRYKKIEPVFSYEQFVSTSGKADVAAYHAGLNYWVLGHVVNVKGDLGFERDQAAQKVEKLSDAEWVTAFTLQTQLFF